MHVDTGPEEPHAEHAHRTQAPSQSTKNKFRKAQSIIQSSVTQELSTTYLRLAPDADLSLEVHAAYSPMESATSAKSPRKK